jgi:GNAT superfamily N-acetyltransferase
LEFPMDERERFAEGIEREALLSLHEHCPPATREALGLRLDRVDDVLVAVAEHDSSILLNRALGLGVSAPVTADTISAITEIYRRYGIDRYFLHVYPSELPGGSPELLLDAGLERARGWMKFRRGVEKPPDARTDLEVVRIGRDKAPDFGRIVASAFGLSDAAVPLVAGLADDERWQLYMSFDNGVAAGAGGLFILNDCAWVEWGATEPEFRRRGSQGAITSSRINAAIDAGCQYIFTETGEAAGDDPQHSYGNILRFGFEASILRENWTVAG